jgi:hypothetical protein
LSYNIKNVSNYKKLRANIYNIIELLFKIKETTKIKRTKELIKSNEDANKKI